jgi:hypothetical protein
MLAMLLGGIIGMNRTPWFVGVTGWGAGNEAGALIPRGGMLI